MKINTEPTFVETSNIGETKRATIKASSKIFNFFADQIYSDKFTAIWRELVANGIDAQKINGVTRPPIVTVPSMLEPYAKVRDFGTGMGHEFMMNKFMAFTDASTKEDSNDFIGGFGIGSKAPLSYTDQYSIRCFQRGAVRVYSVFKDEEDCPCIAFLGEDETSEPDGVEVAFPVRQDDISKFSATVVKTLEYFNPQPVLENTELELTPIEYDVKGKGWGLRPKSNNRQAQIIIGGVCYPFDVNKMPRTYDDRYRDILAFSSLGLDIYLDIGDANIALNREHLTHDEALFDKIGKTIKGITEEFSKQLELQFKDCKTLWEAKALLWQNLNNATHHVSNLMRKHAKWNGQDIQVAITPPDETKFNILVICYGSFGYNSSLSGMPTTEALNPRFRSWPKHGNFKPDSFTRIVLDDVPQADQPAARIRSVLDQFPGEKILFIRDVSNAIVWKDLLEALGGPPASMVSYLSKYAPKKLVRAASGASAPRPFKCYVRYGQPYRGSTDYQTALPANGGLYIQMDNFSPEHDHKDIEIAKGTNPKNIVWLNRTDFMSSGIDKLPNWVSVEEAVENVKKKYRSEHKRVEEAQAVYQAVHLNYQLDWIMKQAAKAPKFPKTGPLAKLRKLYELHADTANEQHARIRVDLLKVDVNPHLDKLQPLIEEAQKKYPLTFELAKEQRRISGFTPLMIQTVVGL